MGNLYFAKVKKDAIIPTCREEDAGRDIYACFKKDYMIIEPFTSALIPTGIATAFPSTEIMILCERGSTGVRSMKKGAGIIDSGFRGEIFFCMYNGNETPILITKDPKEELEEDYIVYPYSKAIGQILMIKKSELNQKEISYEELLKIESERGTGSLGSSGK